VAVEGLPFPAAYLKVLVSAPDIVANPLFGGGEAFSEGPAIDTPAGIDEASTPT
jgi:hypothetical protein